MPIHDWSRVPDGIFHDFHGAWITELRNALNAGLLPPEYYALSEQRTDMFNPDVLTLQANIPNGSGSSESLRGTRTLTETPPQVRLTARLESKAIRPRQRHLAIRHVSGDRVVALIEIVSPGNKSSEHAIQVLVDKVVSALTQGYHFLIVDVHPRTPRDPQGIHGLIWAELGDESYRAPADKPLTAAAYVADHINTAFVEPLAVGDVLIDMPLFLASSAYVQVPLETAYQAAYRCFPQRWKTILEESVST